MNDRSWTTWMTRLAAFGLLASLLLSLPFAAQAQTDLPDCPICDEFDLSTYTGPLSEPELIGLLRALNDEYHAWAVYDQVIADHGQVLPFTRIRQAEDQHIERLLPLLRQYVVLPIPDNPWPGEVARFDSVSEACQAGVEAEQVNAGLYTIILDSTARQDILDAYRDLQRASLQNHLPAFERCAAGSGSGGEPGGSPPNRADLTERAFLPDLSR